ncbi:hypothetical protein BC826DRAFT_300728 [Russula brevipes]|nr:hypothetical protein BC826DRAFT_300728 [Russula brevipes]
MHGSVVHFNTLMLSVYSVPTHRCAYSLCGVLWSGLNLVAYVYSGTCQRQCLLWTVATSARDNHGGIPPRNCVNGESSPDSFAFPRSWCHAMSCNQGFRTYHQQDFSKPGSLYLHSINARNAHAVIGGEIPFQPARGTETWTWGFTVGSRLSSICKALDIKDKITVHKT